MVTSTTGADTIPGVLSETATAVATQQADGGSNDGGVVGDV